MTTVGAISSNPLRFEADQSRQDLLYESFASDARCSSTASCVLLSYFFPCVSWNTFFLMKPGQLRLETIHVKREDAENC